MGRFIHDKTGERDGVFDSDESGHRSASPFRAIHDAGFHLNGSILGEGRSTARVEEGIVFQFPNLVKMERQIVGYKLD